MVKPILLKSTPGHHLTYVPLEAQSEPGIVKLIFEAIFAFIHEVSFFKKSEINICFRIKMLSLRCSCRLLE
jgi:hypothetical protein